MHALNKMKLVIVLAALCLQNTAAFASRGDSATEAVAAACNCEETQPVETVVVTECDEDSVDHDKNQCEQEESKSREKEGFFAKLGIDFSDLAKLAFQAGKSYFKDREDRRDRDRGRWYADDDWRDGGRNRWDFAGGRNGNGAGSWSAPRFGSSVGSGHGFSGRAPPFLEYGRGRESQRRLAGDFDFRRGDAPAVLPYNIL